MAQNDSVLMIFAKAPVKGFVKTRLIPALGSKNTTELYKRLIESTIQTAHQSRFKNIQFWVAPDIKHPFISDLSYRYDLQLYKQIGINLGQKMGYAFNYNFNNYNSAILIGCDCPMLTPDILNYAKQYIESGYDAVLGPAADGGYYLIGLRDYSMSIFEDKAWGQASIANQTRHAFKELNWSWKELKTLTDLDRVEDLKCIGPIEGFNVDYLNFGSSD